MNELKEPQVKRQFLLRNPPVRSEPRPQQRPKALDRVDMDFAKSIPILVARELPGRVTYGVVGVAPFGQPTVNVVFIGVDNSSFSNRLFDHGAIVFCCTFGSIVMTTSPLRCIIPKIGGFSFSSVPRPRSPFSRRRRPGRPFFLTSSGLPLCPATTSTSSHSTSPLSVTFGFRSTMP